MTLEWDSDGLATLQLYAWSYARKWEDKNKLPQKIFFALVLLVLIFAGLFVIYTSLIKDKFWNVVLGVGVCYFVWYAFHSIFLTTTKRIEQRYLAHFKSSVEHDMMESTAGHWSCSIHQSRIEFQSTERGLTVVFNLAEISRIVRIRGQIAFFAGEHLRGHIPDRSVNEVELFDLLCERLRSANSQAEVIEIT